MAKAKTATWWLKPAELPLFLFQLLILLLPVQLGYHLWPSWSHIYGLRVDYLAPTFYLTDLLVFALLFFSLFHFHVYPKLSSKTLLILFGFLLFITVNIYRSSLPFLAFYKWLKVGEFLALSLFVSAHRSQIMKNISRPLSLALLYTTFISLMQFIGQSSLGGLFYYLGERSFTASTPGIALFTVFGHRLLRPYATFPHPNTLAAFALISLIILLFGKSKPLLVYLAILAAVFLIIISNSQTVWFVTLALYLLFRYRASLLRPRLLAPFLIALVVFSLLLPFFSFLLNQLNIFPSNLSVSRRLELALSSGIILMRSPWFGVGLGNFIPSLPLIYPQLRLLLHQPSSWWLQPVHNIYLLTATEAGLIGLLIFLVLSYSLFIRTFSSARSFSIYALLAILLTGLLDHYWLTLQQTQLLFSIIIGLSL